MAKYENQLEDFFGVNTTDTSSRHTESIKDSIIRKLSLRARLRLLPKVLSRNERYVTLALLVLAIGSVLAIPFTTYLHFTTAVPAHGGSLSEGILGEPRLINPLLAPASDADRDLASLMYSGLMRYNGQGKLVPDLAKSFPEITSDGLSYSLTLRDDARWQDGVPITADDVIFTIQTIQNPDYGAAQPVRVAWQGVNVEKVNDHVVIFHLRVKYAQFTNNFTLGLLPKHLWQDVRPINFSLSELNIKPVGSGPYRFKSLTKDDLGHVASYKVQAWDEFYDGRPYIDEIEFKFYASEDELIDAFNNNDIDNVGFLSGQNVSRLKFSRRIELNQLKMPRYYALFLNPTQSKALSDKNVRLAMNYATDRVNIINTAVDGNAFLVNSPMLGGILDINANVKSYDFNLQQASDILKNGGWKADAEHILARAKDNRLEFTITTSTFPELATVAQTLKEQYEKVGAKVTVQTLPIAQLTQVIRDRSYQALLFGQILSIDPDPFVFWHSSQRQDQGQNLAMYHNATADRLLEEARGTLNPLERMQKYNDFQNILIEDAPAVFLYSPHYLYGVSRDIKGVQTSLIFLPSNRFDNIRNWYIDTTRKFK